MRGPRKPLPGADARLLVKDAARLLPSPSRRLFLRGWASVGALALLTGCDITDGVSAERALRKVSEFNDWVRARLFDPSRLAPTYPAAAITHPFRFNAFYPEDAVPDIDEERYRLIFNVLIENKQPWSLEQRHALPQETQITRLICVEGWSSIDMATALHPQTQMTYKFDGQILPAKFGFPLRIRIPTKLGFKNPKHVIGMAVLNDMTVSVRLDEATVRGLRQPAAADDRKLSPYIARLLKQHVESAEVAGKLKPAKGEGKKR